MDGRDVIDIGLRVIKRCGMYSEEYKTWIARENESPPIIEMIDFFKEYWAAAISLVNQTAIPAANHGYGMNMSWTKLQSHRTANRLRTSAPHTPPRKNR
jgi:hypothetical protein